MNKTVWWIIAIIIIAASAWFVLTGKAGEKASDTGTGPIKIGASLPLTGEAASYGEMTKAGIDLAVKEINSAGGVKGRQIQVVFEDDKCARDGANVFSKLVNIDKVVAIVGPVCSAAAGPGIPIAQQGGVPTIIWASAPGLPKKGGNFIFRTYPSDSLQGRVAAEYIYNTLGKHSAAILYVKNDWGQGLNDTFAARFKELGGTITHVEGVTADATDMRTELAKIKASNPEIIYTPLYPAGAGAMVKQAKSLGIKTPLFGGDALDTKEFSSVPEAEGVLFTEGKLNNPDAFKAKVKQITGKDSGPFTPLGYDSIKILAQVIGKVGTGQNVIKQELTKLDYTAGVSLPEISFDADRDLKSAQVEIRIIHGGKGEVYQK